MPKYQEIGGEIYVEGGPRCEPCDATGKNPCYGMPAEPNPECVYCHGAGTEPLSKWPDKVKAEWLAENPPKNLDGCLDCSEDDLVILWNRIEKLWYVIYQSSKTGFATVTYGPDYSAVLTVAVTTVAKEQ